MAAKPIAAAPAVNGRAYPVTRHTYDVLVVGAGVAGLAAIGTANSLGAIVRATDVRPEVADQIESMGGEFVKPDVAEGEVSSDGYAKEMGSDYAAAAALMYAEQVKDCDIVITTALIPGKPAPKLLTEEMVTSMKPGAVIIDLAAETGGNCELTEPGKVVVKHGVKIVGHLNVPGRLPKDASQLFARNVLNFLTPHVDKEQKSLAFDWEDETVSGTLVTKDGKIVNPMLTGEGQ